MKRMILLAMTLIVFAGAFCAKTIYTYRLVTGSGEPVHPYVFSNTPNTYGYKIQLSPSYAGSAPGNFKIILENGKFPDGKTEKSGVWPNEVVTVIWNDVLNVNGNIKIEEPFSTDTTKYEFKQGNPIQISHKIASLKGQVPNMTLTSISPPMGNKSIITGELHGVDIFLGIMVKNNFGIITNLTANRYEWTLPPGWATTSSKNGTFIVGEAEKNISIIPDYFSEGEVKVRAMNDFNTAGSEYKVYSINRGFKFTSHPTSIVFGDIRAKTFSVAAFVGVTYEWSVPDSWKVNGQGSSLEGYELNSVSIKPSFCTTNTNGIVRVRLKKDGHETSWLNCPYSGVSTPTINLGSVYQYETSSVTFDGLDFNNIQSISWSGNGVENKGNLIGNNQLRFNQTGDIQLSATVFFNGCTEPLIFTKVVSVQPDRLNISGPTSLCDQEAYKLAKTIPNLTYFWGSSNSSVSLVSGQYTDQAVFKRNAYLDAVISLDIYENGVLLKTAILPVSPCKPFIVGSSQICDTETYSAGRLLPGTSIVWQSQHSKLSLLSTSFDTSQATFKKLENGDDVIWAIVNGNGLSNYFTRLPVSVGGPLRPHAYCENDNSWYTIASPHFETCFGSPTTAILLRIYDPETSVPLDNFTIEKTAYPNNFDLHRVGSNVTVIPRAVGSGQFKIYKSNECGPGNSLTIHLTLKRCGGSGGGGGPRDPGNPPIIDPPSLPTGNLIISPNPANAVVSITFVENESDTGIMRMNFTETTPYVIQLWNSFGFIKSITTNQLEYQMDLTGVPAGFYYIHVIKDGQIYRKQLVVQ